MCINTAEKIETIVLSYLALGTTEGSFGTLVDIQAYQNEEVSFLACYRVMADGKCFIVRSDSVGWEVRFGPWVGVDADLYVAAHHVTNINCGGTRSILQAASVSIL